MVHQSYKILHVTPGLADYSGPAAVALGLCKAMALKGMDVTLFTTNFGREAEVPLCRPVDYHGIRIYYFPISRPRWYLYSPALGRALKQGIAQFDIVHIHGTWLYPTTITAYHCRKNGVSYLIRPRGNLKAYALRQKSFKKKIYSWLIEKRNLNKAAAIHFLNYQEAKDGKAFGIKAPFFIIPNGVDSVDEKQLRSLKGRFRSRHSGLIGKKVILFLGRIDPIKGLDRLCKAFGRVAKKDLEVRLVLAGPDSNKFSDQVRQWLRDEGVIDYALFVGPLAGEEKLAALVDADVFCLPSYQEGHSIALTEAMACKIPVVITRSVGFSEVEKVNAGIVVDGRLDELSDTLLKLLSNTELRQQMGENARKLILEKYTWGKIAEQVIAVYEKILLGNPNKKR